MIDIGVPVPPETRKNYSGSPAVAKALGVPERMADFAKAFQLVMKNEGDYVHDPADPGGETYRGVARSRNPAWAGWVRVDVLRQKRGFPANLTADDELQRLVSELYQVNYWHRVNGDKIRNQEIANSIFDFAVNAGPIVSSKLAQIVCGVKADGVVGPQTLKQLNSIEPRLFLAEFALAKLARYVTICERTPRSRKFFFGWCRRILEGI